jgi:hypothetical protein
MESSENAAKKQQKSSKTSKQPTARPFFRDRLLVSRKSK